MLKNILVLSFATLISFSSLATTEKPCTREAMETLNNKDRVQVYIEQFEKQNNSAAVAEIEAVEISNEFKLKHSEELDKFGDEDYLPSQAFCDDAYIEIGGLYKKIEAIVSKYSDKK